MLSAKREGKAAKKFLIKVLKGEHNQQLKVIKVDRRPTSTAFEELKDERILARECQLRQVKYLNNIIEQDCKFLTCDNCHDREYNIYRDLIASN